MYFRLDGKFHVLVQTQCICDRNRCVTYVFQFIKRYLLNYACVLVDAQVDVFVAFLGEMIMMISCAIGTR